MLKIGILIFVFVILVPFLAMIFIDKTFGGRNNDKMYKFLNYLYDLTKLMKIFWEWVVIFTHFVGVVCIVCLLACSIVSFVYVVFQELGGGMSWFKESYGYISNIIKNPVSWATATTIVATTIAVGHMQNQSINKKRFETEKEEMLRKKGKRKVKRQRKLNVIRRDPGFK